MKDHLRFAHVVVSGGTHGNEFTGAYLAQHWLNDPNQLQRTTFKTLPLFANPRAFQIVKRYVERDLNRSFHPSGEIKNPDAFELTRAAEIEAHLRSECNGSLPDAIFDLHSTTAHMGMSLVLTNREPFNLLLYAYLRMQFSDVRAYLWEEPNSNPGFLNSLSKNGFAVEVGAVANGVLNAEWVFKTSQLVNGCLDFIELWNQKRSIEIADQVPLYCFKNHIDYPRAADGLPAAMIHPKLQGRDFECLKEGDPIFVDFNGQETLWKGNAVWPVFINEAAYYEKGIAFTATERIDIDTKTLRSFIPGGG